MGGENSRKLLLTETEEASFEEAVRTLRPGLILYINGIVRDLDEAEDLAEDCFVAFLRRKPSFAGESARKAWFYKVGRNLAVDHLRKHGRVEPAGGSEDLPERAVGSAEELLLKTEMRTEVYGALLRLPAHYAQVLWLSFGEELSNEQIAGIMKLGRRQTETLLYRAKRALKQQLREMGESV